MNFQKLDLNLKSQYDRFLLHSRHGGCEFSFVNLFLWGRQKGYLTEDTLFLFSQFDRRDVYPYPVTYGDRKQVIDAIMADAKERGIPCRLTSMSQDDCRELEALYPGRFRFRADRDTFDYVYDIHDLADLKGRKFQKKRNHLHRFEEQHPSCQLLPLDGSTRPMAQEMLRQWYIDRSAADPTLDFHMEKVAMERAFEFQEQLGLEGLLLMDEGRVLAFTMGSRLSPDTFDVHFEKAREDVDGAYAAINRAYARYIRETHPEVLFLNREEDMGLEGLRKAKSSYNPHHMVEKYWARLWEDEDET